MIYVRDYCYVPKVIAKRDSFLRVIADKVVMCRVIVVRMVVYGLVVVNPSGINVRNCVVADRVVVCRLVVCELVVCVHIDTSYPVIGDIPFVWPLINFSACGLQEMIGCLETPYGFLRLLQLLHQ